MKFDKLFMRVILSVLMLGTAFGITVLIGFILPGNYIGLVLDLVLGVIILMTAVNVYHKLYRAINKARWNNWETKTKS